MDSNVINIRKVTMQREIIYGLCYFIFNFISLILLSFLNLNKESVGYYIIKLIPYICIIILEYVYSYLNFKFSHKINILTDDKNKNQKKIYKQYFGKKFFKFFIYKFICFFVVFIAILIIVIIINIFYKSLLAEQYFGIFFMFSSYFIKGVIIFFISLIYLMKKNITIEQGKYGNTITSYPQTDYSFDKITK